MEKEVNALETAGVRAALPQSDLAPPVLALGLAELPTPRGSGESRGSTRFRIHLRGQGSDREADEFEVPS